MPSKTKGTPGPKKKATVKGDVAKMKVAKAKAKAKAKKKSKLS